AVDLACAGGGSVRDQAVLDQHVRRLVAAGCRVDDARALQQQLHAASPDPAPPSMRYSSDIRTAMPFVTCSVITDCGRSATSDAISTPRFIGPGCMIIACSGSAATRSRDSPNSREYS